MPKSILVVDDDVRLARAVLLRLSAAGYQAVHADCGRAAIERAGDRVPDAVILDIRLPDMDGFDVCRHLRAMPPLRNTPIVFLSANASREDRQRAAEAGGTRFFAKPCSPPELLATLKQLCGAECAEPARPTFPAA